MHNFKKIPLSSRLYAFAIDVFIISVISSLVLYSLAQGLNEILLLYGKNSSMEKWHNELSLFSYSIFPIFFFTYFTLAMYSKGKTLGSHLFGYCFFDRKNHNLEKLSLKQSAARAGLLIISFYSAGATALTIILREDKYVITDLIPYTICVMEQDYHDSLNPVEIVVEEIENRAA